MLKDYLAVYAIMGGARMRRAVAGMNEADARATAALAIPELERLKPTLVSVTEVPAPRWNLTEPLRIPSRERYTSLDVRNHFLNGGAIACSYQGRGFMAVGVFHAERTERGIGTAFLSCDQAMDRVVEIPLDGLDEQHALETLNSALIVFASELGPVIGEAA